ncbi:MAG TPA: tyrosine-type recombinase/integrase [Clostridiales bacterium]|nr:tyrosine-type recombinase/integrase [Clostridiales bacterium]
MAATAKKLPSGSWRALAYSHSEPMFKDGKPVLDENGKQKQRRVYESFTSDDPSPAGKKEAEFAAAEFMLNKGKAKKKKKDYGKMKLGDAIDEYIKSRKALNRSPTTIQEYECTRNHGFQDLMDMLLEDIDEEIAQEAINVEAKRPSKKRTKNPKPISAKRLKNEWCLINAVLHKYRRDFDFEEIELPKVVPRAVELPPAREVLRIIKGTDIELPVLLAAWLSFSMSEVRGLTKSKSVRGNYIMINEVVVDVHNKPLRKDIAKNPTRNRRHRIPPYIKSLIDQVEGDALVPISGRALFHRWIRLQNENNIDHITFHDLRHLNASIMALLRVPDKYAQERGGWKSDQVMKKVYMQTFSEERERVDDLMDEYFEKAIMADEEGS